MTAVRHRDDRRARLRLDRRKLLAIASAFSVLGVGAGVTTLATWQQSMPLVGGTGGVAGVGASRFCIEESLDGTNWSTYASSATLSFPAAVNSLSPGDTAYASILLATCASSVAATVTLAPTSGVNSATPFLSALTYGVTINATSCSPSAGPTGGTSLIATGASTAGTGTFTLPVNTGSNSAPSSSTPLCFGLGLPTGAVSALQGQTGTPSWTLTAHS